MPDMLKVSGNERLDLSDFTYAANNTPAALARHLNSQLLTNPSSAQRCWVVSGFAITNPSASQISVEKGVAILSWKDGNQVYYGMLATEGDTTKIVDIAAYVNGSYDIYIRFEFTDSTPENRIFWNSAGLGSEFSQVVSTRRSANWSVRIEATNPGGEWFKIGTVVKAPAISLTDKRNFYFEGAIDASYANTWGAGNDRNANRALYGVHDFQSFTAAMRTKLEDVMGKGGGRWWQDQGYGISGTQKIGDTWQDYVVSGLNVSIVSGLGGLIGLGICYAGLTRVVKAADTSKTFTASKDTYVDLNWLGVFTYVEVANGAGEPGLTANSLRLAKVVTSGAAITSITNYMNEARIAGNRQTALEAGQDKPVYLRSVVPSIGLNAYYDDSAATWRYGRGSSGSYSSAWSFDPATGKLLYSAAGSTGNANAAATLTGCFAVTKDRWIGNLTTPLCPGHITYAVDGAWGQDIANSGIYLYNSATNNSGAVLSLACGASGLFNIMLANSAAAPALGVVYCNRNPGGHYWMTEAAATNKLALTAAGNVAIGTGIFDTNGGGSNYAKLLVSLGGSTAVNTMPANTSIWSQGSYNTGVVDAVYNRIHLGVNGDSNYGGYWNARRDGSGGLWYSFGCRYAGTDVDAITIGPNGYIGVNFPNSTYRFYVYDTIDHSAYDRLAFLNASVSNTNDGGFKIGTYVNMGIVSTGTLTGRVAALGIQSYKNNTGAHTNSTHGIWLNMVCESISGTINHGSAIYIEPPNNIAKYSAYYSIYAAGDMYLNPSDSGKDLLLTLNRASSTYNDYVNFATGGVVGGRVGLAGTSSDMYLTSVSNSIILMAGVSIRCVQDVLPYDHITQSLGSTAKTWLNLRAYDVFQYNSTTGSGTSVIISGNKFYPLTSDRSVKKDIVTLTSTLDVLQVLRSLRGVYFNWDTDNPKVCKNADTMKRDIGMIAQEVEEAGLPELVRTIPNGLKTINYNCITGYLVEVCKALHDKISTLEAKVAALEN